MTVEIPGVVVKSVVHGDRRMPAQVVQCGYCGAEAPVLKTGKSLRPPELVRQVAVNNGWQWAKSGKHACPKCLKKFKAKKMAASNSNAPREMQPSDKRAIFREVDANYDDVNQRYLGAATDQEIAKKIGVPRKWVETVREADFGPSGVNEEMHKVASVLGELTSRTREATNLAMEAAAVAEKLQIECETLRKRLDAIDSAVGPRPVRSA